jgi:LytS/YehU family sensor histidine kinase
MSLEEFKTLKSIGFLFGDHFGNLLWNNGLDVSGLKVPPLIIQPYVENAIWHGLMHKEEKGNLQIDLFEEENMLCCKITDDGVGRKRATELKSKSASTHKSMGMQNTADRIAMLHKVKELTTQIQIADVKLPDGSAGGTELLLKIPFCYD